MLKFQEKTFKEWKTHQKFTNQKRTKKEIKNVITMKNKIYTKKKKY